MNDELEARECDRRDFDTGGSGHARPRVRYFKSDAGLVSAAAGGGRIASGSTRVVATPRPPRPTRRPTLQEADSRDGGHATGENGELGWMVDGVFQQPFDSSLARVPHRRRVER